MILEGENSPLTVPEWRKYFTTEGKWSVVDATFISAEYPLVLSSRFGHGTSVPPHL